MSPPSTPSNPAPLPSPLALTAWPRVLSIGPLFFAGAFDAILFGVLCTHMWYYYTAPKRYVSPIA